MRVSCLYACHLTPTAVLPNSTNKRKRCLYSQQLALVFFLFVFMPPHTNGSLYSTAPTNASVSCTPTTWFICFSFLSSCHLTPAELRSLQPTAPTNASVACTPRTWFTCVSFFFLHAIFCCCSSSSGAGECGEGAELLPAAGGAEREQRHRDQESVPTAVARAAPGQEPFAGRSGHVLQDTGRPRGVKKYGQKQGLQVELRKA